MVRHQRQVDTESDPFLDALKQRIGSEVAVLRALERDIDEADTDSEAPVAPESLTAAAVDHEPAMAQPLGDHMRVSRKGGLAAGPLHVGRHVTGTEAEAAFGLRARAKRERDKRRRARKKDAGSFSLAAVNERVAAFTLRAALGTPQTRWSCPASRSCSACRCVTPAVPLPGDRP